MATGSGPAGGFQPITQGQEFEFIALGRFKTEDELRIDSQGIDLVNGVVVCPQMPHGYSSAPQWMRNCVHKMIGRGMELSGLEVNEPDTLGTPSSSTDSSGTSPEPFLVTHRNPANTSQSMYFKWNVFDDPSVVLSKAEKAQVPDKVWEVSVKIVSPAFNVNEAAQAIEQTQKALMMVDSNFLYYAPTTSGLHVHVGQGKNPFGADHLKRIAAVLFAIDPAFSLLHPRHRDDREQIPRPRYDSNLARQHSSLGGGYMGWVEAQDQIEKEAANSLLKWHHDGTLWEVSAAYRSIENAAKELLSYTGDDVRVVERLMRTKCYGTYAFNNYGGTPPWDPLVKPTIEFRQAAGTLNAQWANVWTDICTRTVDWARRQPDEHILELAQLMDEAEQPEAEAERNARLKKACHWFLSTQLNMKAQADYINNTTPVQRAWPQPSAAQTLYQSRNRPTTVREI